MSILPRRHYEGESACLVRLKTLRAATQTLRQRLPLGPYLGRLEVDTSCFVANMSIHFVCPLGHQLSVPDDRAGRPGRCPVCHQRVFAPQRRADAAQEATEPESQSPRVEMLDELPSVAPNLTAAGADPPGSGTASLESGASMGRPIQPPPSPWQ